jgi:hypothetical protein
MLPLLLFSVYARNMFTAAVQQDNNQSLRLSYRQEWNKIYRKLTECCIAPFRPALFGIIILMALLSELLLPKTAVPIKLSNL